MTQTMTVMQMMIMMMNVMMKVMLKVMLKTLMGTMLISWNPPSLPPHLRSGLWRWRTAHRCIAHKRHTNAQMYRTQILHKNCTRNVSNTNVQKQTTPKMYRIHNAQKCITHNVTDMPPCTKVQHTKPKHNQTKHTQCASKHKHAHKSTSYNTAKYVHRTLPTGVMQ